MMTTGRKPVRVVELTLRKETSGCKFRVWFGDPPCGNWLLAELVIRYVPVGASCVFQAGCACRGAYCTFVQFIGGHHTGGSAQPSGAHFASRQGQVCSKNVQLTPTRASGWVSCLYGGLLISLVARVALRASPARARRRAAASCWRRSSTEGKGGGINETPG